MPGFQLTHSRGVRHGAAPSSGLHQNFNSRTHVECDQRKQSETYQNSISTHALTWSATICDTMEKQDRRNFNSRTHVECDVPGRHGVLDLSDFNSRTHVECDPALRYLSAVMVDFNSRTHVECDGIRRQQKRRRDNFNSRTHVECDCSRFVL